MLIALKESSWKCAFEKNVFCHFLRQLLEIYSPELCKNKVRKLGKRIIPFPVT